VTRVVDLHPEELLDRDARGELSAADEARLEAHLARCAACRFERQLRADFADELGSELTPSMERLALGSSPEMAPKRASVPPAPLLEVLLEPPLEPGPDLTARPRRSAPRRLTRITWLLVAAAVCVGGVAGATGAGQRVWSHLVGDPVTAPAPEAETAPSHVAAKHSTRHRAAAAPTAVAEARPEASTTVDVLLPSAPLAPPSSVPSVATPARHGSAAHGAASLFEAATEARRQGSYARAIDLQRELFSRYPRSRESHVARETMGRLLLDRGDPAGAFASFDAYLSEGSGELGEEAMVGRATALERLGRSAQAVDAWRGLLAAYPETPYAAHAKSRLGSLSVR
jgi:TolA-binding protein